MFGRNGSTITRTSSLAFHTFAAQTITFGAFPAVPTITNLGLAAYKRLQAVGTVSIDFSTSMALLYTQPGAATTILISGTQAWLGGTAVTLAFPDFSAASGWNNAWAPAAGRTADWTYTSNVVNYTGPLRAEGAKLLSGLVTGVN